MSTVTSSYSVARRPAGANQAKSRSEIARGAGRRGGVGRRVGRRREAVLEDPLRVDPAAGDQRLDGLEHRRRAAHVHVGVGQLLVDRLVHEAAGDRREAKVGQPFPERGDLVARRTGRAPRARRSRSAPGARSPRRPAGAARRAPAPSPIRRRPSGSGARSAAGGSCRTARSTEAENESESHSHFRAGRRSGRRDSA